MQGFDIIIIMQYRAHRHGAHIVEPFTKLKEKLPTYLPRYIASYIASFIAW